MTSNQIIYPFGSHINPLWDKTESSTISWAAYFGLLYADQQILNFKKVKPQRLTGRLFPNSNLPSLKFLDKWVVFFFLLEDWMASIEKGRAKDFQISFKNSIDHIMRNPHDDKLDDFPFTHAFHNIWSELLGTIEGNGFLYLKRSIQKYFDAKIWLSYFLDSGRSPTVSDYMISICHLEGATIFLNLAWSFSGINRIREYPLLDKIEYRYGRLVGISNDLIYSQFEIEQNDHIYLLKLIQKEYKLPEIRCLYLLQNIGIQYLKSILDIEKELMKNTDPFLIQNLEIAKLMAAGFKAWALEFQKHTENTINGTYS